jgi:hypothetical protein
LDRVIPASLRASSEIIKGKEVLLNEHKNRLFFFVSVNDKDFPSSGVIPTGTEGSHLRVRLTWWRSVTFHHRCLSGELRLANIPLPELNRALSAA